MHVRKESGERHVIQMLCSMVWFYSGSIGFQIGRPDKSGCVLRTDSVRPRVDSDWQFDHRLISNEPLVIIQ
jgi:hypothetical protein